MRLSKEEVIEAARQIKTRENLMPTNGPSEPHIIVEKLEIENLNQMEAFICEVAEALLNMHVVKDNENISYERYSANISLIARMMWARKETAEWKVENG
jgi:hypothetical protein